MSANTASFSAQTRARAASNFRIAASPEDKASDFDVEMATHWETVPGKPLTLTCHSPFIHRCNERGQYTHSEFSGPLAGAVYLIDYSEQHGEWRCSCPSVAACWHIRMFEREFLPGMLAVRSAMQAVQSAADATPSVNRPRGFATDAERAAAIARDFG